jgi:hypothetical protein
MERIEQAVVDVRITHPHGAWATATLGTRYGDQKAYVRNAGGATSWNRPLGQDEPDGFTVEVLEIRAEGCTQLAIVESERRALAAEEKAARFKASEEHFHKTCRDLERTVAALEAEKTELGAEVAALQRILARGSGASE